MEKVSVGNPFRSLMDSNTASSSQSILLISSSALIHRGEVHASRKSKGISVKHGVVRVEEVIVAHAVVGMAAVVGRQGGRAREGRVL
jgi:hypothetical protein